MNNKPRYILDTSTLISAVLFEDSKPGITLRKALRIGILLMSPSTLEEIASVLQREKFDPYVSIPEREEFLEALVDGVEFIEPTIEIRECRDSKDDKYLELGISGKADCIITSDDDLLVMNPFRGISIITPSRFLDVIEEKSK